MTIVSALWSSQCCLEAWVPPVHMVSVPSRFKKYDDFTNADESALPFYNCQYYGRSSLKRCWSVLRSGGHFSVLINPIVSYKCSLIIVFSVHLNLPVPRVGIHSWKYARFSKSVYTLIHTRYWIAVSYPNRNQPTIVDTRTETSMLFRWKYDEEGLFCYWRLGNASPSHPNNSFLFQSSCSGPALYRAECVAVHPRNLKQFWVLPLLLFSGVHLAWTHISAP